MSTLSTSGEILRASSKICQNLTYKIWLILVVRSHGMPEELKSFVDPRFGITSACLCTQRGRVGDVEAGRPVNFGLSVL